MFKNYLTLAIRSFSKDRTNGLINLAGLAIALCCVFMILAYVQYERSYDRQYSNAPRAFRLVQGYKKEPPSSLQMMQPVAYAIQEHFPEVEHVTRLNHGEGDFIINDQPVKLQSITTDAQFLQVFDLPFVYGNNTSALQDNIQAVITEKIARSFFPGINPVGKTISQKAFYGKPQLLTISGVIKDLPPNLHFKGEIIVSEEFKNNAVIDWNAGNISTEYLLLKKGVTAKAFESRLEPWLKSTKAPEDMRLSLQPVQSIHLHSNLPFEPYPNSNIRYVYIFSLIALVILIIACINSINLTTARSLQRVREVGVRKVMGAERKQLAFQFTTESVVLFFMALPAAMLLAHILWPSFARAMNINAGRAYLFDIRFIAGLAGVCLLSGALSGIYPAIFLSGLRPAHILKDWQKSYRLNMNIRRSLIVFQFAASVTLIVATAIVSAQLRLLNTMDLGFDKNYVIALPFQMMEHQATGFKNELKKYSHIEDVSISGWKAGEQYSSSSSMNVTGDSTKEWHFVTVDADFDFFKTMHIPIVRGRGFSRDFSTDHLEMDSVFSIMSRGGLSGKQIGGLLSSVSILVTEQTVKSLKLKEPVIGQTLSLDAMQGTIVGVVKDFVGIVVSPEQPLVVIRSGAEMNHGYTYIRVSPTNISATIDYIRSVWKKTFPDTQFSYSFVDERLQQSYTAQQRLSTIFNAFALLAIALASMGLFSVVSLTVQQKTKEIGIRKVLGAGVAEVVQLLSKDFLRLIVIGILIATPVAWWAMSRWLQDFNYRININIWYFVGAGLLCLIFAFAIISIKSLRAAMANPIDSLRTE